MSVFKKENENKFYLVIFVLASFKICIQLYCTEFDLFQCLLLRILGDKNFSAAILMSNCQGTTSDRESVIGDLSKLITVDIYGACGKLPPNSEDHGNQDASEG